MYTLGEAVRERFADPRTVAHVAVEDFLPRAAVAEDLKRYKFISNYLPFLLYLTNTVPLFYYRKYFREAFLRPSKLQALRDKLDAVNPRTVICISHRPGFWVSNAKYRHGMNFQLWGLLGEYGNTPGWRYIFWAAMNGFLSPVEPGRLTYPFPAHCDVRQVELPARREYSAMAEEPGARDAVLLVCGYWGQGPFLRTLQQLVSLPRRVAVHVVCGENATAREAVARSFSHRGDVTVHGTVESLAPLMRQCACVITKPGISTLLEAHAAGRKIWLLKGMPVAEDNNARYAVEHFDAEWFHIDRFRRWIDAQEDQDGTGLRHAV
jgi:hypothetical protein